MFGSQQNSGGGLGFGTAAPPTLGGGGGGGKRKARTTDHVPPSLQRQRITTTSEPLSLSLSNRKVSLFSRGNQQQQQQHQQEPEGGALSLADCNLRLRKQWVVQLNREFQRKVAALKPPSDNDDDDDDEDAPFFVDDLSHEYMRCMRDIQRWSASGQCGHGIVSFGTDDFLQLGRAVASEDDKAMAFPPLQVNLVSSTSTTTTTTTTRPATASPWVVQVAAGGSHSAAVNVEGDAYTWGLGDEGILGRPAITLQEFQARPGNRNMDNLQDAYDLQKELDESTPKPLPPQSFVRSDTGVDEGGTIISVAAGNTFTLFLARSGQAYMCGYYKDMDSGKFYVLPGENPNSPCRACKGWRETPVHVVPMPGSVRAIYSGEGCGYCVALLQDWTLVTWGFGNSGELARSKDMTRPKPDGTFDLGKLFFYKTVKNKDGEEDFKPDLNIVMEHFLTPKPVRWAEEAALGAAAWSRPEVAAVGCGSYHLLVAARQPGTFRHQLYSSGLNNYGQLGQGDEGVETARHELTPVEALKDVNIVQLAAGEFHSLALNLHGDQLYAWGRADSGQLGLGKSTTSDFRSVPTPTFVSRPPRDNPADEPPIVWKGIAAGGHHSMAWTTEHVLYTWGQNEMGAAGHVGKKQQNQIDRPTPLHNLAAAVKTKKKSKKATSSFKEDNNNDDEEEERVVHVVAADGGGNHSLALVKIYKPALSSSSSS